MISGLMNMHPNMQSAHQVLDDSGDDWDGAAQRKGGGAGPSAKRRRAMAPESFASDEDEEGEVDDLDAFDDGYGSDLMGDDDDRCLLQWG
jgi:hypothetical protein